VFEQRQVQQRIVDRGLAFITALMPGDDFAAADEGAGLLIATVIVAAIGNGHAFNNRWQFSACRLLVAEQNQSGRSLAAFCSERGMETPSGGKVH
jgi:hypothetical protein